jgi:hypothetical protein
VVPFKPDRFHGGGAASVCLEGAMNCPTCGLVNPPTAQRCDCGYDFAEQRQKQPLTAPSRSSHRLSRGTKIVIFVLIFLGHRLLVSIGPKSIPPSTAEPSIARALGYLSGSLITGLLVSALIAFPIIWLVERVRSRHQRVAGR